MQQLSTKIKEQTKLSHPNLIKVMGHQLMQEEGYLCGENNRMKVFYEYYN